MTKDDLIQMADLAGYDVDDDDDVYAPASGRYWLDPRLEKFAQLVAGYTLRYECRNVSTKSQNVTMSEKRVQKMDNSIHNDEDLQAAVLAEREACAKLCDEYLLLGNKIAKAIRGRTE